LPLTKKVVVADLLQSDQELVQAFLMIDTRDIASVANDKLVHVGTTRDAPLSGFDAPQVRFQFIVGAWQTVHVIAGEQSSPPVAKGLFDVSGHELIFFICPGGDLGHQVDQVAIHGLGHALAGGWRLTGLRRGIQQVLQINEPLALSPQPSHLIHERQALVYDGDETP
jgi:hypothetical protein